MSSILPPLHLLAYSTLLGTELYQTFVVTKITYRSLPRPAFVGLQRQIFPIYFKTQSVLLLFVAITLPPHGLISLFKEATNWIPFAIAGVSAGLNLILYGPRTKALMIERSLQVSRDANLQSGKALKNKEMATVNRSFSRAHAMSIHLNLVTIGATLLYGLQLASNLRFDGR